MKSMTIAACLAATTVATAAPAETLRLSHFLPPGQYLDEQFHVWADALKEASNGELDVTIFPAGQLGGPGDHYDMAKNGIADVTWIIPGYSPGVFPIIELVDLPFMIGADQPVAARAVNHWYAQYAETEMPDVHVCVAHVSGAASLHSDEPFAVPADLKGMNVRTSGSALSALVSDLGASAVQVPGPEIRATVDRGMVDALFYPWGSLVTFGVEDKATYHLGTNFYYNASAVVFNKAKYEGLSDSQREAVDSVCTDEWAAKLLSTWAEADRDTRARFLEDDKHTFHMLTDEELALWREAAQPGFDRWAETVRAKGLDPDEVRQGLIDAVEAAQQ